MKSNEKLNSKNKVLVIVGPTASGKSELAVSFAEKFNGEVISADSRQVYRHLDIGTGKVCRDAISNFPACAEASAGRQFPISKLYFHKGIRHHLIDVASPRRQFSAARFQRLGQKALRDILRARLPAGRQGKVPIICGGTGFYIDALLSPDLIPAIPPQRDLRRELEKRTLEELYDELRELAPERAKTIDRKNKRRLIRALEIVRSEVRPQFLRPNLKNFKNFQILKIGLLVERAELKERIRKRFLGWVKKGFLDEVEALRQAQGLSWSRIESFGLNYRAAAEFLQGKISMPIGRQAKEEMIQKSISEIYKYSKRQMTWFRRDKDIRWVRTYRDAEKLAKEFIKS